MAAAPESAGTGKGLIGWIDQRFPLTKLWKEQVAEYYAPKNFNFWYYFGVVSLLVLVQPAGDRNFLDDELQAILRGGVFIDRIHHAGRGVGLADPLHAFHRRIGVLHRDLSAHVPRAAVRLASQTARTACGFSAV